MKRPPHRLSPIAYRHANAPECSRPTSWNITLPLKFGQEATNTRLHRADRVISPDLPARHLRMINLALGAVQPAMSSHPPFSEPEGEYVSPFCFQK